MITIYHYHDPANFLKDRYQFMKEKNSSFSIRSWAKVLKIKHHNSLFEILKRKRKIPPKLVPTFIASLKLDRKEGAYFYQLVNLQRSKSAEEKELILNKLNSISTHKKLELNLVDTFTSLKDPLHIIITELSCLKNFSSDPKWIKNKLGFKTTIAQIEDAIRRLIETGIMRKDEHGHLIKTNDHTYSKSDVLDLGLQIYHKNVMALASKAIDTQKIEDREYNAYCINIDKTRLPEIKKFIRNFLNDFAIEFEVKDGKSDDTYQLNTQFFNLTDHIDKQTNRQKDKSIKEHL
ncbi:MAG: TIGR02147 family protein [Bacteriovoracaceae bacterium]|nr:TIGR02147 family protein [Bacteriovoracaceae bacterium]